MKAKTNSLKMFAKLKLFSSLYSVYKWKEKDLEKLEELASSQSQVKDLRWQNKLGKQNFSENIKKVFEPVKIKIQVGWIIFW